MQLATCVAGSRERALAVQAGLVVNNLQQEEYGAREIRAVTAALFGPETGLERSTRAAFAVFDTGGEGSLDAGEMKAMMPLLSSEELPID